MSTINELLQEGIRAAKGGQVEKARRILKRVIEQEPHNEMAWLWLSSVVETDEQRMACLENVLAINPHHQAAQRGLQALRQKVVTIKPLLEETIAAPTPTVSRPPARKSGPWVAVALVALAMLVVGLWCSNRWNAIFGPGIATSTPIDSAIGKQGTLHIDGGASSHFVAADEKAFQELLDAINAKDDYGVSELLLTGRVFSVKDGTQVLVIDAALHKMQIRILEGPYAGKSGWVPDEWVVIK
jgi:hypothetical protein